MVKVDTGNGYLMTEMTGGVNSLMLYPKAVAEQWLTSK